MLKTLVTTLALGCSLFAMHEAELNLNNYDLNAKLDFDMGQFNDAVDPETVFLGARYLRGSYHHSDELRDKDHDLFDAHFAVAQRLSGNDALTLGLGVKFVYTSIEGYDFDALPIGVFARYELPLNLPVPFIVGGALYYAPEVLAWQDAKNYLEYDLSLDIRIIDRAAVTAGYRKIDTDFDLSGGDFTFNEAWYVGVKFRF
ncbi:MULTISPECIES: YfaZ family outer membrane protein [Sulfurimonas]|uniref:YfaZ family outer membrane protein n=1 Tax=Sulfurimonas diazotrophicus TaxID=3131939 RepID=A0ABZ3H8B1_9BACT